jgi:hypothetical protein
MPDEPQADQASEIERLRAQLAESVRAIRLNTYQRAHVVRRMADVANRGNVEQVAEDIARARDEHLADGSPLLEPYRLSLLAKHVPLDDWADDPAELARQSIDAAAAELCELATEHYIAPRLLLLLDSYERLIAHFAGMKGEG